MIDNCSRITGQGLNENARAFLFAPWLVYLKKGFLLRGSNVAV